MAHNIQVLNPSVILYHGSKTRLPTGYSENEQAAWFSLDYTQSLLHTINQYFPTRQVLTTCQSYMYKYEVIKPVRLLELTGENFPIISKALTGKALRPFTGDDYVLSKAICEHRAQLGIDGWIFLDDQRQVMICNPREYLRVVFESPIIQTPQVLELCRLVNQLNNNINQMRGQLRHLEEMEPESRRIDVIEANMQETMEALDDYSDQLSTLIPEPTFTFSDASGNTRTGAEFDHYARYLEQNPSIFKGWRAFYQYRQTVEDAMMEGLGNLRL